MKRVLLLLFTLIIVSALAACGSGGAEQAKPAEAAAEAVVTEAPVPETASPAPEAAAASDTPYFTVSFEDGTPVPDKIEGKAGEGNALRLFFAVENGEGMVGWDRAALEAVGVHSDMSFQYIDEKGLLVTLWSEGAAECVCKFFINGSDDWANPDVLFEKEFAFVFAT